jgi:hypothetical protein
MRQTPAELRNRKLMRARYPSLQFPISEPIRIYFKIQCLPHILREDTDLLKIPLRAKDKVHTPGQLETLREAAAALTYAA